MTRYSELFTKYSILKRGLQRKIKIEPYKYARGDEIDALFGQAIMRHNCAVQIERLASGKYRFGSRNIIAKIINGKLVIRVGGGYMSVDEFIQQYGPIEMLKMQKFVDRENKRNSITGASARESISIPKSNNK